MLSHYRLIEKIGEGGMGVVWKAEDTVLTRTVAIKVLPADVSRDEKRRQMFLEEARLASSISDARIVQVFEFGRERDLDFIVMEYVEGSPLNKILHGRPLPAHKVAEYGHQVARALAKAHRKGLLHRDLKPGNILVTPDGDVKVVDFGLATLFTRRDSTLAPGAKGLSEKSTRTAQTEPAQQRGIAGTLPYMSPEQVKGEKLDSRSDIFSLGAVLYEMTTGHQPFRGATAADLAAEIQKARFEPVHELVPMVPLDLDKHIHKALAALPGERYQTMDDLAVDLKRLGRDLESGSSPSYESFKSLQPRRRRTAVWWAIVALVIGAVAVGSWLNPFKRAQRNVKTILILPIEVRGQTDGADYVSDAFTQTMTNELVPHDSLRILPVPGPEEFASSGKLGLAGEAEEYGADYVVRGTVHRSDNKNLANLTLLDVKGNEIIWSTSRESDDKSFPSLAINLARDVGSKLGATPPVLHEYWMYFTGSPNMSDSLEFVRTKRALLDYEVQDALDFSSQLVELFPTEPEALALRAYAVSAGVGWGILDRAKFDEALLALDAIEPGHPTGETLRCEWLQGIELIECADRLLPREDLTAAARAWVVRNRSAGYLQAGDLTQARTDCISALQLDPLAYFNHDLLGRIEAAEHNSEGARQSFERALALRPGGMEARFHLAALLGFTGQWDDAREHFAVLCERLQSAHECAAYALSLLRSGDKTEAVIAAEGAMAMECGCGRAHYLESCFWAEHGETEKAIPLLEESIRLGFSGVLGKAVGIAWSCDAAGFEAIVAEATRKAAGEDQN